VGPASELSVLVDSRRLSVKADKRGSGDASGRSGHHDDPEVGLLAVVALRGLLEQLEALQVKAAREQGWTWERIAQALGVTRQSVHKKYAGGRLRGRRS